MINRFMQNEDKKKLLFHSAWRVDLVYIQTSNYILVSKHGSRGSFYSPLNIMSFKKKVFLNEICCFLHLKD